jgi:hypothetical protein
VFNSGALIRLGVKLLGSDASNQKDAQPIRVVQNPKSRQKLCLIDCDSSSRIQVRDDILFLEGEEVARTSGAMSATQVVRWVRDRLPTATICVCDGSRD